MHHSKTWCLTIFRITSSLWNLISFDWLLFAFLWRQKLCFKAPPPSQPHPNSQLWCLEFLLPTNWWNESHGSPYLFRYKLRHNSPDSFQGACSGERTWPNWSLIWASNNITVNIQQTTKCVIILPLLRFSHTQEITLSGVHAYTYYYYYYQSQNQFKRNLP